MFLDETFDIVLILYINIRLGLFSREAGLLAGLAAVLIARTCLDSRALSSM
jgi:hypothetical protein